MDGYDCKGCSRCDEVVKGMFGEKCDGVFCKRPSGNCADLKNMDSSTGCPNYDGERDAAIHLENILNCSEIPNS